MIVHHLYSKLLPPTDNDFNLYSRSKLANSFFKILPRCLFISPVPWGDPDKSALDRFG